MSSNKRYEYKNGWSDERSQFWKKQVNKRVRHNAKKAINSGKELGITWYPT